METHEVILEIPLEHERNLFGGLDCHVKKIERTLRVSVILRDGAVKLVGSKSAVEQAKNVFSELLTLSERGNTITEQNVDYVLALSKEHSDVSLAEIDKELIGYTIQGKPIKPKTRGQQKYVNQIQEKMMVFGIGPAGTGKTYLAMAMAIQAFKNDEVSKIILTRPAIEAGENLGFLPGDLQSKIDPYLRPLYDALYQIMGADSFIKNFEKGLIEVAPLAYMRGRTLEDLPFQTQSGLEQASKVLEQVEDIGFSYLTNKDVVRHPLVQKIVHAYEKYEARENYKESRKKASTQTKKAGKR